MPMDYRALLLAGLTILLWGCWGFLGKLALDKHMAPTSVFLAEVCTSAVCAVPVLVLLWRQHEVASLTPSWNVCGVASGAGLALGLFCYYFALETSHASILVPLTAIYPAVSVVLSYAFLHERPQVFQWVSCSSSLGRSYHLQVHQPHGRQRRCHAREAVLRLTPHGTRWPCAARSALVP